MKQILLLLVITGFAMASNAQAVDRSKYAQNDTFRVKTQAAGLKAAQQILTDTTASARAQYDYCYFLIMEPQNSLWIDQLSYGCLTNPVITPQSPDGTFEFVVNGIFAQYAKAYKRRYVGGE